MRKLFTSSEYFIPVGCTDGEWLTRGGYVVNLIRRNPAAEIGVWIDENYPEKQWYHEGTCVKLADSLYAYHRGEKKWDGDLPFYLYKPIQEV